MTNVDINKYISGEISASHDPEGNLLDLPPWNEREAQRLAAEVGITLTDDHWDVVRFLRERYLRVGPAKSGRVLAEELDRAFHDRGGSRYLYQLFPNGPVSEGLHIAGLPSPAYTTDPSFGSAE